MSAEENSAFGEPSVESSVSFKLPERKSGTDAEMETDNVAVFVVGAPVGRDADAINILGELFTIGNVAFHGDASEAGCHVNWEDVVLVVDFL